MMNVTPIPFFSICHYISAFSIFFIDNLMKDDEQNQTISAINALSEYFNMSNELEGKTQLLTKVLEISTKGKTNADKKYVDETYKYILGFFHHYRNISRYFSVSKMKENVTYSIFRDIVFQSLSDIHNLCSTSNGSSKLTPLEPLGEYIRNYIQERDSGRFISDKIQPLLKRIKRQPYADFHNVDASEIIAAAESMLNENSNDFHLSDSEYQRIVPFLQDDEPNVNPDLWDAEELDNILLSLQKNEHSLGDNSTKNQDMRSLEVLETTKLVEVGNKRQHDDTEKLIPRKIQSLDILDGIPGTSKESEASILQRYALSKDGGKSRRILAIERAAHVMFSCHPKHAFTDYVNKLKRYILKLEESTTKIPTYDQLARDFCYKPSALRNYQRWQIPKHKFIDDVLFGSNLDSIDTYHELGEKLVCTKSLYELLNLQDFETYKSSSSLKRSLRIQDYLLLKHKFKSMVKTTEDMRNRVFVALYRLILRQCEEKWIENNVTLYRIEFKRNNLNISHSHTFKNWTEFSSDIYEEKHKLSKLPRGYVYYKMFKIQLENQAGIARIDNIVDNVTRNYLIPPNTTFKVIGSGSEHVFHNFEIYTTKLEDTQAKEDKMIEIVKKLYRVLINSDPKLFSYYN